MAYNARKSGVGMRSRPRIAKQSRKRRLTADQACLYLTADVFFIATDDFLQPPHKLNWQKLLETVTKLVRPNGVQRPKRAFGAEIEAEEASIVSLCQFLFLVSCLNLGIV